MIERGTKKWTSIMMPEHIEMLKTLRKEAKYKNKPILDDQQVEENAMKLQLAIHDNLTVEIKYFKKHGFHVTRGKLLSIISNSNLVLDNDEQTKIKFEDVLDVAID